MARVGDRVELVSCSDPYTRLEAGEQGEVTFIDSVGTVHVRWDSGSTLGLVVGQDRWFVAATRWDLLVAEAESLGYTVELVEYCETPASPGILGSRAGVCLPHLRKILVRKVLDAEDRLTVLAHELEHARGADHEIDVLPKPLLNFEKNA